MKRFLAVAAVAGLCLGVTGTLLVASISCTRMACHSANGRTPVATVAQASAGAPVFANTKCPIMGGAIDPAKVPESLTRVYKDQKVAFCCGMCPAQWDRLTDAQKGARLQ